MDITGLSVSIDVDMSGFVEAMDELLALIKTVSDEMFAAAARMEASFESIREPVKDVFADIMNAVADLAALVASVALVFTGIGIVVGIAGIVASLAKLIVDVKKLYDDWHESTDETTESIKKQDSAIQDATKSVQQYNRAASNTPGSFPDSMGMSDGTMRRIDNSNVDGGAGTSSDTNTSDQGSSSVDSPIGALSSPPQPSSDEQYKQDYLKNLDMMHELAPPQNAKLHIGVEVVGINDMQQGIKVEQNMATATNKEADAHQKAGEGVKKHSEALQELTIIATQTADVLAEDLGKTLAGQKNINPLGDIAKIIGQQLTKMGEAWIAAGIAMTIGLDPLGPLKLAEGTALTVAGSAMSAIKMADGGIVHGSTFANIGEYAGASHNPEVVAPLDKLRGMVGGGGGGTLTHRIQGSDLLLVLNTEMKNQGLSGGGNGLQQYQT